MPASVTPVKSAEAHLVSCPDCGTTDSFLNEVRAQSHADSHNRAAHGDTPAQGMVSE